MAMAETAQLIVDLRLQDRLTGGIKSAQRGLTGLGGSATRAQGALSKVGQGFRFGAGFFIAQKAMAALPNVINSAVTSLNELEAVEAQTAAGLKSTGGAAGITAAEIRALSESLEDKTTIDDKVIQSGANLLLTFTNIQNRVGDGNDIFSQATTSILDMSVAMGQDTKTSAVQLGKALNDPIGGITSLKRIGIQFTAEQRNLIKSLVESGDVLSAQKIILAEVNKEMGGRAVAQAGTYAGQVARLGEAFENLQLAGVKAALPGLTTIVTNLASTFRDPGFIEGAEDFGKSISALATKENFEGIKSFVASTLPPLVEGLKLAGQATKTVVDLFRSLPPELQKLVVAGVVANKISGGLVGAGITGAVKGGAGALLGGLRGATRATPVYTQEVGPGGTTGPAGGKGGIGNTILGVLGVVSLAALANEIAPAAFGIAKDLHKSLGLDKTPLSGAGNFVSELEWPFGPKNTPQLDIGPFKDILGGSHQSVEAAALTAGGQTLDFLRSERAQNPIINPGFSPSATLAEGGGSVLGGDLGLGGLAAWAKNIPTTFAEIGKSIPAAIARGIAEARAEPLTAFEQLVEMLKHPLTQTGEVARLTGELASAEMAAGLASGDPEIRARARETRDAIIFRLNEIGPRAGIVSKAAAASIALGLSSEDPAIVAAMQGINAIITGSLPTPEAMTKAGTAAGAAYLASFAAAGGGLGPDGMPLIEPPKSPTTPKPKPKTPLPGVRPPSFRRGDPGRTQVNLTVQPGSTDWRQNSLAKAITNRYGATPAEAGSQ